MPKKGPAKALEDAVAAIVKLHGNIDDEHPDEMLLDELKRVLHAAQAALGQLKAESSEKIFEEKMQPKRATPSGS